MRYGLLIASVVAFIGITAPAFAQNQNHEAIEKGAKLFIAQKCSLCHSIAGKGNPKGPLDNVGEKLKADDLRKWITTPAEMTAATKAVRKPAMKAYPDLPKDDLEALVGYLASLKAK